MSFLNHNQFLELLNSKTLADHKVNLEKYKVTTDGWTDNEITYFSKYLFQGERKGLSATANVVQARLAVTKLFNDFPHLKTGEDSMTTETTATPVTKTTKAKSVKAAKAAKVTQKVAKVKATHADGVVWFNAERNKFIVTVKGERAARPTAEACKAWVAKKFPEVKARLEKVKTETTTA